MILDQQRYWAFIKAYIITFVALIGLYVVIDAFNQLDEFTEVADGTVDLFRRMGWYYLIRLTIFYDRLCGVITMMAAIFTVTWMQRNNELLAMLAAGLSTQRVIRPVIVSAALVSLLAVVNQEWIIPSIGGDELIKAPDDDDRRKMPITSNVDVNGVLIHGYGGSRGEKVVEPFNATLPSELLGTRIEIEAKRGHYLADNEPGCPLRGGWLLTGAGLSPPGTKIPPGFGLLVPLDDEALADFPAALRKDESLAPRLYFLKGHGDLVQGSDPAASILTPFAIDIPGDTPGSTLSIKAQQGRYIAADRRDSPIRGGWVLRGVRVAGAKDPDVPRSDELAPLSDRDLRAIPEAFRPAIDVAPRAYFLRTHMSFAAITRNPHWFQFAPTTDLIRGQDDPANALDRLEMAVFLHSRILRPVLSLMLLFVTLPQVLGGEGRNMFINLGISLATSGVFYGVCFLFKYLGDNAIVGPELAAWIPLFLFGTLAVLRWDRIRT